MFSIPISKSPPHPRYTILESRFPLCNAISEGRPPLCNTSSEAGRQPSNVHIEKDSGRKFSKSKMLKVFLETTFLHSSCHPDHYEPKIFFWFFEIDKFSCFLSQFRSPHLTLDIRSWSRGSPFVMRSRKAGLPYAIRVRKRGDSLSMYVSRMTLTENFLRQTFLKFSWKSLFSTVHVTLIIMSRKCFFWFFEINKFSCFLSQFRSPRSEAGALPSEVRIEDDSDRKFFPDP